MPDILQQIKDAHRALAAQDVSEAVEAVVRRIHYKVEPDMKGESELVFKDVQDVKEFYKSNNLQAYAFDCVIEALESEGVIYRDGEEVYLKCSKAREFFKDSYR